jgi:hypothetical protein
VEHGVSLVRIVRYYNLSSSFALGDYLCRVVREVICIKRSKCLFCTVIYLTPESKATKFILKIVNSLLLSQFVLHSIRTSDYSQYLVNWLCPSFFRHYNYHVHFWPYELSRPSSSRRQRWMVLYNAVWNGPRIVWVHSLDSGQCQPFIYVLTVTVVRLLKSHMIIRLVMLMCFVFVKFIWFVLHTVRGSSSSIFCQHIMAATSGFRYLPLPFACNALADWSIIIYVKYGVRLLYSTLTTFWHALLIIIINRNVFTSNFIASVGWL